MSSENNLGFLKPEDIDPNLFTITDHTCVNGRVKFKFTYDGKDSPITISIRKKHGININYDKVKEVKEKTLRDNITDDLINKLLPDPMVIFHNNRMSVLDKKDHEKYEKWSNVGTKNDC